MTLTVCDIGRTRYADAWSLQRGIFEGRLRGEVGDILLFTEHEHVYTFGKGGDENHLLAGDDELREKGVDVFRIDRGGDVTYHGPGQLVGYPILNLASYGEDIHRYLRNLEESMIRSLADFGIQGGREEGMTGVWVKGEKIAAIGVKVSRWVTMHGFALNVNTDLSMFHRIIPCGIFHKGVTSMQALLGEPVPLERVQESLTRRFGEVFGCAPVVVSASDLRDLLRLPPRQEVVAQIH